MSPLSRRAMRIASPGTYVFEGEDFRDELALRASGTFSRTALCRGGRPAQRGRHTFM
jgi:hypothetical protein